VPKSILFTTTEVHQLPRGTQRCVVNKEHNYHQFMGGVDRHDHLRSSFSLCKAHHFRKYYVKLFLFILDVGITNAWIYYKMCNGDNNKKYGTRADFFQSIAESMVSRTMNWSTMLEQE
jgi:hypothetical protein